MVGIYHVAEDAPKRLEGEPTIFLAGMVRMLPIEIRYPKQGEIVESLPSLCLPSPKSPRMIRP